MLARDAGYAPFERPLVKVITTKDQAVREVKDQKNLGYDFVKVYSSLKKEVYQSIIEASNAERIPVIGHIPFQVELDLLLTSNQKLVAHAEEFLHTFLKGFDSKRPFDLYEIDPIKAKKIAKKAGKAKLFLSTTLIGFKSPVEGIEGKLNLESDEDYHFFPSQMHQEWLQLIQQRKKMMSLARFNHFKKTFHFLKGYVKTLKDSGVIILAGTDTPYLPVLPGFSLHDELKLLVSSGFTPYEALATATSNVGKFLNRPGFTGTIEIGSEANLLLIEKNPLENIEATKKITGVFTGGRWYFKDGLVEMLETMKSSKK